MIAQVQTARIFAAPAVARSSRAARFTVQAAARPTWYPGATPPKHLDGSMTGDYGFDPLRLGTNQETIGYFQEAEKINARWAMLACVGILAQEALGKGDWWTAGAQEYAVPLQQHAIATVIFMGVAEALRSKALANGNKDKIDPAGMDSPEARLKEIKNGRLGMVAFLGMSSAAAVQGCGPIEALQRHLADPAHNNIITSSVGHEAELAFVVLPIIPIILEARNALSGPDDEEFRPIPW